VAAAIVAAPVGTSAQTSPAPKQEPKAPPNPQPASPQQQPPQKPSPVAEAYAEVARARFREQVTDEELERIKRDLQGNVRTGERLGAVKLNNWDEPDFIFNA
jgi:hypothetical protein